MIIEFIEPKPLTVDNAWVSGFGDGHFNINHINFQPSLGIDQKDKKILKNIARGGSIYYDKSRDGWILWYSGMTQLKLMISYLYVYPLHNPYKIAKLKGPGHCQTKKGFERYLRYLERGYYLDPAKQNKFFHFIKLFQSIGDEDIVH